jgi:hypothetical protein
LRRDYLSVAARAGYHFRVPKLSNEGGAAHLNVIETERLNLREMSEADAEFVL